jgi:hypothetical protein
VTTHIAPKRRLEDIQEADGLRWLATLLRTPIAHWPVHDTERSSEFEPRDVCDELGELHACDMARDCSVLLPVRVAMQSEHAAVTRRAESLEYPHSGSRRPRRHAFADAPDLTRGRG